MNTFFILYVLIFAGTNNVIDIIPLATYNNEQECNSTMDAINSIDGNYLITKCIKDSTIGGA